MPYYTLVEPAPTVGCGWRLDMDPDDTYVAVSPRVLPVDEMTGGRYQTPTQLAQSTTLTLVRVEPAGELTGPDEFRCYTADGGWTVTAVEPSTDPVLGPQAARIREVIALAETALTGWGADPRADTYEKIVNSHYQDGGPVPDVQPYLDAAEAALADIGSTGLYWTGCVYGWELLALAARDLLGTTPEWTQVAYDTLTEPWRAVMGVPVHPDDTAPVPAGS